MNIPLSIHIKILQLKNLSKLDKTFKILQMTKSAKQHALDSIRDVQGCPMTDKHWSLIMYMNELSINFIVPKFTTSSD